MFDEAKLCKNKTCQEVSEGAGNFVPIIRGFNIWFY